MAFLSFVSWKWFGVCVRFKFCLLYLFLLHFFLDDKTLCLLLDVWMRVPVNVQPVCAILLEEELLEVSLEF
jgi:hypothetical protein